MRYFLDTEFIECRDSINLITLGIVGEDGSELYLLSNEYDSSDASDWVIDNVLTPIYDTELGEFPRESQTVMNFHEGIGYSRDKIAEKVKDFIKVDDTLEFWAYYGDYDWVVFCWLFGSMMELPEGYPMYCRDLKQSLDESGKEKLPDPEDEHNALADARWNKALHKHIYG